MATCSSKLKGETEQEFRKRCGGYTYAFPIDLLQKKEEEPSTEEPPTEPTPPAPEGDVSEARHTKGNIYKGKLKVDTSLDIPDETIDTQYPPENYKKFKETL